MKKLSLLTILIFLSCNTTTKKNEEEMPGRLGNKDLTVNDDKRINQKLLQAMINIGLDGVPPAPPVTYDSSKDEIQEFNNGLEPVYTNVFGAIFSNVELPDGLTSETKTIIGDDGNEIKLYITKPEDISGEIPGILHLHGGGIGNNDSRRPKLYLLEA